MVICLERGADLHVAQLMPLPLTVSCFSKIQIGFTFLVPAHPDSLGQRAVKRVCVCVCALFIWFCRFAVYFSCFLFSLFSSGTNVTVVALVFLVLLNTVENWHCRVWKVEWTIGGVERKAHLFGLPSFQNWIFRSKFFFVHVEWYCDFCVSVRNTF